MSDNFPRNLAISMVGHVVLVLLILFRAVMTPSEPLQLRNAIRVDIVGLPQKTPELPEMPAEKAQPAPTPSVPLPKKVEVAPPQPHAPEVHTPKAKNPNVEKAEKRALEKLKALEAVEKIQAEVGKANTAKPKAQVVGGNKVSAGNSLTGLEKIAYDRYFDEIEAKVHSQWSIPQWLADSDLKAQVMVLIDERGYVVKKVIRKSSGNEIFDSKVLEAIDSSSPLPPPPERLRGVLSTSGIVFNFPQ